MSLLLAITCLALAACANVCPQREALLTADGGQVACLVNTDCPRPANVLVCTQTEDQLRDCVSCEETHCVRYRPKACP